MTQVASSDDLTAYMSGIRLPADAAQIVDVVLAGLQGELEGYLGYPLAEDATVTEWTQVSTALYDTAVDEYPRVTLQRWPIAEVLAVSDSAGTALDPAAWSVDESGVLRLHVDVLDVSGYIVTYRPGLPPNALTHARLAILRVAAREMQNKHDDTRSTAGTDGRPPAPLPEGWQRDEKKAFSRWRRRGVFSRPRQAGSDVTTSGYGYGSGTYTGSQVLTSDGDATRIS